MECVLSRSEVSALGRDVESSQSRGSRARIAVYGKVGF